MVVLILEEALGKATANFRYLTASAMDLAIIAILPNILIEITGITTIYFGGTSVLIMVGVALETVQQIESHMLMRHYEGFIKK